MTKQTTAHNRINRILTQAKSSPIVTGQKKKQDGGRTVHTEPLRNTENKNYSPVYHTTVKTLASFIPATL